MIKDINSFINDIKDCHETNENKFEIKSCHYDVYTLAITLFFNNKEYMIIIEDKFITIMNFFNGNTHKITIDINMDDQYELKRVINSVFITISNNITSNVESFIGEKLVMNRKKIICITGKTRTGKDYTSSIIKGLVQADSFAFADKLKDIVNDVFSTLNERIKHFLEDTLSSLKLKFLYKKIFKHITKELTINADVHNSKSLLYRSLLEATGTNLICKYFDSNYFVDTCIQRIDKSENNIIIITDLRYLYELERLSLYSDMYEFHLLFLVTDKEYIKESITLNKIIDERQKQITYEDCINASCFKSVNKIVNTFDENLHKTNIQEYIKSIG